MKDVGIRAARQKTGAAGLSGKEGAFGKRGKAAVGKGLMRKPPYRAFASEAV